MLTLIFGLFLYFLSNTDFVSTRCRTRSKKYDDAYTIVASQEECNGKFMSIHGGPGWPSGKLVYDRCGNLPDSPENSCGLKNKCHPGRYF